MEKNDPFSLFKQKPQKKPSGPITPPSQPKVPESNQIPSSTTPNEINDILKKMTQMHDELQKKIEETYQKSGWSLDEIKSYLENPNNFSQNEWERVQRERKYLSDQMWSIVGEEGKRNTQKKEILKEQNARKGKMLGARKKNWIPIR